MQLARLVCALLIAGCGGGPSAATLTPLGSLPSGTFFGLSFDRSDTPHVVTTTGMYRWTGSEWTPLPSDGLTMGVVPALAFGPTGDGFTLSGAGHIYRLPAGGAAWEIINPSTLLYTLPTSASDGTLYAKGRGSPQSAEVRLFFKRATDTAWTDSGIDVADTFQPLPDTDGNLWTPNIANFNPDGGFKRVHEMDARIIPPPWGTPALGNVIQLYAVAGGTIYGSSLSYTSSYGQIRTYSIGSGAVGDVTDGSSCASAVDLYSCKPSGVSISSYARSPSGDFYEMLSNDNGFAALMKLDGETWTAITSDEFYPGTGIVLDSKGHVYLQENDGPAGAAVLRVED
jgi:hypothetical protein